MKLINIGFGNLVSEDHLIAIVSPDSAPIKRMVQESRERGTLIDASYGRRTRSVLVMDNDHLILSALEPEVLLCDEATSALDSVTEAKIQRAFDNLAQGRTTLIIAHRLSTIRSAGRIISIADGVITECGTHQELLAAGGIYADLYRTQNAGQN